tara:strand:+ start:43 stop:456 length:414 start_codon:yes stop_codon:yes gene_type:complete
MKFIPYPYDRGEYVPRNIKRLSSDRNDLIKRGKEVYGYITNGQYGWLPTLGGQLNEQSTEDLNEELNEIKNWLSRIQHQAKLLEWDLNHIFEEVDIKCRLCESDKTHYILLPEENMHFAKHICMDCGAFHKWLPKKH